MATNGEWSGKVLSKLGKWTQVHVQFIKPNLMVTYYEYDPHDFLKVGWPMPSGKTEWSDEHGA